MRGAIVAFAAVLLAACSAPAPNTSVTNAAAADAFFPEYRYERMAPPYPGAASVRLFIVRAYGEGSGDQRIYVEPQGRLLTPAQRQAFEATLRRQITVREGAVAACFVPHHFFRYYDRAGRQVGEIAICFCCLGASIEPAVEALGTDADVSADYDQVRSFVEGLGLPTNIHCS